MLLAKNIGSSEVSQLTQTYSHTHSYNWLNSSQLLTTTNNIRRCILCLVGQMAYCPQSPSVKLP